MTIAAAAAACVVPFFCFFVAVVVVFPVFFFPDGVASGVAVDVVVPFVFDVLVDSAEDDVVAAL